MSAVLVAGLGAAGVYLLYTATVFGWSGLGLGPATAAGTASGRDTPRTRRWMAQAGLPGVSMPEFLGVSLLLAGLGAVVGLAVFGTLLSAAICGSFLGLTPVATYRRRRQQGLAAANDAWPHMIEEIRVLTGAAGRSIPAALFEVGSRCPRELRPAFDAAEREWLLSTDFERTVGVLEELLVDPAADAVCETLLVAHEIGGADLDRRLAELAEDRRLDTMARKDARSKQAGVRFARRFVIIVPMGMALAGVSLGDGRAAYQTTWGQALVSIGIALMAACWAWSGQMLKLPSERRVFGR